jgi:homoserine acetyltransferase
MKLNFVFIGYLGVLCQANAQGNSTTVQPTTDRGQFTLSRFTFDSGEKFDLELHYQTLGKLKVKEDGISNAVLLLHGM